MRLDKLRDKLVDKGQGKSVITNPFQVNAKYHGEHLVEQVTGLQLFLIFNETGKTYGKGFALATIGTDTRFSLLENLEVSLADAGKINDYIDGADNLTNNARFAEGYNPIRKKEVDRNHPAFYGLTELEG